MYSDFVSLGRSVIIKTKSNRFKKEIRNLGGKMSNFVFLTRKINEHVINESSVSDDQKVLANNARIAKNLIVISQINKKYLHSHVDNSLEVDEVNSQEVDEEALATG